MSGWESFNKYVGVQGILSILLVIGYILSLSLGFALPEFYTELVTLCFGFYFAKNGPQIVQRVKGQ